MRPDAADRVVPPPADTFAERARQLVAFVAERSGDAQASEHRREEDLADWIWRWQQATPAAEHFIGVELAIILRALHGPGAIPRMPGGDRRQLCCVIAQSITSQA
ncbi:MAG TPA: hypothetical protein VJ743_23860 [Albitalea sp.]|nr:hypothetical protein [Albitalea sp.]